MRAFQRTVLVLSLAVATSACGGDDSSSKADARAAAPTKDAGYFDQEQSDALNPLLADYDKASKYYYDQAKPCEKTAERLFESGSSPRASVQCHFQRTKRYRAAVVALREGVEAVDGDFRARCDEQVATFTSFLKSFDTALGAQHADWNLYASGKPTPKLQQHVTQVDDLAAQFVEDQVPGMSKACFTEADRTAAGKA